MTVQGEGSAAMPESVFPATPGAANVAMDADDPRWKPRVAVETVYVIDCERCGKVGESRDSHEAWVRRGEHVVDHAR